jgi:hypothetical protein
MLWTKTSQLNKCSCYDNVMWLHFPFQAMVSFISQCFQMSQCFYCDVPDWFLCNFHFHCCEHYNKPRKASKIKSFQEPLANDKKSLCAKNLVSTWSGCPDKVVAVDCIKLRLSNWEPTQPNRKQALWNVLAVFHVQMWPDQVRVCRQTSCQHQQDTSAVWKQLTELCRLPP